MRVTAEGAEAEAVKIDPGASPQLREDLQLAVRLATVALPPDPCLGSPERWAGGAPVRTLLRI